MTISDDTIISLVKSQAEVAQAVRDMKDGLDKAIPFLIAKDTELERSVHGVEKKLWYFGGAGSMLGFIGSHFLDKFLGGK